MPGDFLVGKERCTCNIEISLKRMMCCACCSSLQSVRFRSDDKPDTAIDRIVYCKVAPTNCSVQHDRFWFDSSSPLEPPSSAFTRAIRWIVAGLQHARTQFDRGFEVLYISLMVAYRTLFMTNVIYSAIFIYRKEALGTEIFRTVDLGPGPSSFTISSRISNEFSVGGLLLEFVISIFQTVTLIVFLVNWRVR